MARPGSRNEKGPLSAIGRGRFNDRDPREAGRLVLNALPIRSDVLLQGVPPVQAALGRAGWPVIRRAMAAHMAILMDLRSFTALTDRAAPMDVVTWLNEHFDALGEPVSRHGGEILKFVGDGFFAIFPVPEAGERPCPICAGALAAAAEALTANTALNARRRAAGLPELAADLVLHFGDVVYGNIGAARRLDFTVIGRAVNEASRIEGHCEPLGHALLLSDSFAARCDQPLEVVGTVNLRGVTHWQQVWS